MVTSKTLMCAVLLSLAGALSPAVAHHSFAMFDQTKLQQAKAAIVTEFHWANPHSFVVVDVKGTKYTLECSSTNMMSKSGWKMNSIKSGDKVDIVYYPLRSGLPGGMLKTVTLPTGTTLQAW